MRLACVFDCDAGEAGPRSYETTFQGQGEKAPCFLEAKSGRYVYCNYIGTVPLACLAKKQSLTNLEKIVIPPALRAAEETSVIRLVREAHCGVSRPTYQLFNN